MKRAQKFLSIALVLMLALSVMALPASAVNEPAIKADVVATYQGKTTGGYDYYKFSVYIDSTLSLVSYQLNLTWDDAVWQVLRATNFADQNAYIANMVIDKNDPENNMYTASEAYMNYGGGNWTFDGAPYGYVLMPGDGTNPSLQKISNTNMGAELTSAGYTGLYSSWTVDVGDYMNLSGGTLNEQNSPTSGRQMVMSWYMRLKDGVEPGNYEVGFNAKQTFRLTGVYTYNDNVMSRDVGQAGKTSFTQDHVTYSNAVVQVGTAGPAVALDKRQINMELTEDGTDVTGNFAFRAISTITDADWDDYFVNTGVENAKENAIQAVGIVAADKSTFSMEAAQAAAEANYAEPTTETPDYKVAWTNYIQKTGDDAAAYFGARVDTTKDTCADLSYIGVVAYLDGEGALQFLYYDAADTVDLKTDYETNKNEYLGWLASQA